MSYPQHTRLIWFGRQPLRDEAYLNAWREAPVTYLPSSDIEPGYAVDHYEVILGQSASDTLFRRAAALILHGRYYPPEVMSITADYDLENRPVRPGDRVFQRVGLFRAGERPVLEALVLNAITSVVDESQRAGFTSVTTSVHGTIGEWTPMVEWRENGEVALTVNVVSRIRAGTPRWARGWIHSLQVRAQKLGIAAFSALLNDQPVPVPLRFAATPAKFTPFLVAIIAGVLTGVILVILRRRSKQ